MVRRSRMKRVKPVRLSKEEKEAYKMWLERSLGSKRFTGVQLVPIKSSNNLDRVIPDTKHIGIGGEFPTAVIDKKTLKVVYTHI